MTEALRNAAVHGRAAYKTAGKRIERWRNKRGRRCTCYLCRKTFDHFYPLFGDRDCTQLFDRFHVVGSDLENFYCPHCFSFDRERHLLMYFDRLDVWSRLKGTVLHVAPERNLRSRVVALGPREYIAGDLAPRTSETRQMSVTALPFPAGYFDVVLCNHVLEHVPDDRLAMSEIFRVLKDGGCAILQTPYSTLLARSFEDPNITTDELRRSLYGQRDHVRIYGQDFFERLRDAGFELDLRRHADVLGDIDGAVHGVRTDEDLVLVWKRRS